MFMNEIRRENELVDNIERVVWTITKREKRTK